MHYTFKVSCFHKKADVDDRSAMECELRYTTLKSDMLQSFDC